jgi:CheY-like chemotaxis protein
MGSTNDRGIVATRVLVVDDDTRFRLVAAELLRARGLSVAGEAADATRARIEVAHLAPVAVLLDVNLPDGDGLELVGDLLAEGASRVLLTSSDPSATTDRLARDSGAVGFVTKADLAAVDLVAYFNG